MALENLEPATRIESILDGEDIEPATRLEYFLKQAAAGGGGGAAFVINVVPSIENVPTHLDKTYNEIAAAITNEQVMSVKLSNANIFFFFLQATSAEGVYTVMLYDFTTSKLIVFDSETADGRLELNENP